MLSPYFFGQLTAEVCWPKACRDMSAWHPRVLDILQGSDMSDRQKKIDSCCRNNMVISPQTCPGGVESRCATRHPAAPQRLPALPRRTGARPWFSLEDKFRGSRVAKQLQSCRRALWSSAPTSNTAGPKKYKNEIHRRAAAPNERLDCPRVPRQKIGGPRSRLTDEQRCSFVAPAQDVEDVFLTPQCILRLRRIFCSLH